MTTLSDQKEQRAEWIQEAQGPLMKLLLDVCPLCKSGTALFCEVVDGVSYHPGGVCKGSTIRQLLTHMDDVRDQFANPFNEQEKPRMKWGYTRAP